MKQEVIEMQKAVNRAAGKVKRARKAGVENSQALLEAAETIRIP